MFRVHTPEGPERKEAKEAEKEQKEKAHGNRTFLFKKIRGYLSNLLRSIPLSTWKNSVLFDLFSV